MRTSRIEPGALAASIAGHCLLVAAGAWLWSAHSSSSSSPSANEIVVVEEEETPREAAGSAALGDAARDTRRVPEEPKPLRASNAHAVARPDLTTQGRGAKQRGERATNLSSSLDPLTLQRDTPNHLDQSQVQRLRTARRRQSWDDRRATPNPMELDFVASGRGRLALRRPLAEAAPGVGALSANSPHAVGATLGARAGEGSDGPRGASTLGDAASVSAGAPVVGLQGAPRLSAPILMARPSVPSSRAAVPAAERQRPSDTQESDQRVALRVASLLQASTLGGEATDGIGGEPGPGEAGAALGNANGSRAQAAGSGSGLGEPTADPGLDPFYRGLRARVEHALEDTFPHWAKLEGRGGLVVFEFTLDGAGRIANVAVVRPSGIAEFDRNVVVAVRQLPAFGRVPAALASRAIRFTFDERNPAVGRRGPGPGHVAD
ncbi:MAG: energy transducer TonB family protein [Myxococcota bacterium]